MKQTIVGTMRETTTQASRIIRKEIKVLYPDCKFKVTTDNYVHYSLITISLLAAPFKAYKSTKGVIDGYMVVKKSLINDDDRLTDETKKVLLSMIEIINKHQLSDRYFRLEVGNYDKSFVNTGSEVTELKKANAKINEARQVNVTKSTSYDKKGTKFESRTRTVYVDGEYKSSSSKLFINDKEVIKGFESYSGWYWFAVEISDRQDSVIDDRVYENDKIYYGYVQGFEHEWGYFSEADIMRAKPKVWAIPMKNLHYSGKREVIRPAKSVLNEKLVDEKSVQLSAKSHRPITLHFQDKKIKAGGYFGRDGITDKKLEEHYDFPGY